MYQFTLRCKCQVEGRPTKPFLGNQQMSSYFALASQESLLLFILFHSEVYVIENKCSEERETFFFFFFFFFLTHRQSKIFIFF